MPGKPLISILIANYNNGRYLAGCVNSIYQQTYRNWEIVIVDDGSSDDSKTIYSEYVDDPRVRVFFNYINRGCGYTKRRCVEFAKGQILGFVDPDDTIRHDALEVMLECHLKHADVGLIYSTHYLCGEDLQGGQVSGGVGKILNGYSYLSSFGIGNSISHFATFKYSFYIKTSGIDVEVKRAVDQDLYYRMEEVGGVLFVNEPLYNYRYYRADGIEGLSTGLNESEALRWHLKVVENACKRRAGMRCQLPALSRRQVSCLWGDYCLSRSHEEWKNRAWSGFFKYAILAFLYNPTFRKPR